MNNSMAFAVGGEGATCNPSTANWPSCSLAQITVRANVTKTVNIPGGRYATPYIANQASTEYILQGDIAADGTAITVSANYVVINLNRHTITYNQTNAGDGIRFGSSVNQVAIVNGSIIQGAGSSSGDVEGKGNNPINQYNYSPNYLHIANLYLQYRGKDVGGIWLYNISNSTVEQCTLEDTYYPGVISNRHQGVDAINFGSGSNNTVKYNTITNARQRGIRVRSNSEVYQNRVTLRSLDTNSYGIGFWLMKDVAIHDNTIIGRGAHPIGIGVMGQGGTSPQTSNISIYNNSIDVQTTMLAREYGDSIFATGIRAGTYESLDVLKNIKIYDNTISIATSSSYSGVWADTGASVTMTQRGKGLFIGTYTGGDITAANNSITFTGGGPAYGIAPHINEEDSLFIINNTITTHDCHVVLEDSYSGTHGYPLFIDNHFIRSGNNPSYYTVCSKLNGWSDQTARFVDNIYSGGASAESISLQPSGPGTVSVYFGTVVNGECLYTHRYHDNSGASSTLIRQNYTPNIKLDYAVPRAEWLRSVLKAPSNLRLIVN
jgi:parallel beta-helix repeat protein